MTWGWIHFQQFLNVGWTILYGEVWKCWITNGLVSKESYYVIFLIFWFSLKLKRSVINLRIPSWGVQRHESINLGFIGIQLADRKMSVFDKILSDVWEWLEEKGEKRVRNSQERSWISRYCSEFRSSSFSSVLYEKDKTCASKYSLNKIHIVLSLNSDWMSSFHLWCTFCIKVDLLLGNLKQICIHFISEIKDFWRILWHWRLE